MLWFGCKACRAKDEEIHHLLALLNEANDRNEKAQARLGELVSPGVTARLTPRAPVPLVPRRAASSATFPGYAQDPAPAVEVVAET